MSNKLIDVSFDEFDETRSPRPDRCDFDDVVDARLSRRGFLAGALVMSTSAFISGTGIKTAAASSDRFGFKEVPADTSDAITIPEGFSWHNVISWGDPLWSNGATFNQETRGDAASQKLAMGDNNDGMAFYSDGDKSVLAVNNEYVNRSIIYGNRETGLPENDDDVVKGMEAHGVSVFEVAEDGDKWSLVKDSKFNRKITPNTPMDITGPARGSDLVKTAVDPDGVTALGTYNNCGNGTTPWGTYLTCEENFNGYFSSSDPDLKLSQEFIRYGIGLKDRGYAWARVQDRFDISKTPNEPNRAGYIVEIDPLDPTSTPKKLTALGRFKHENAEVVVGDNGHIVVYMGDDERGEFLYRYVSNGKYALGTGGSDLLQDGKLYVARFNVDGSGDWLELNPKTTGMSEAEISVYTRVAGSKVGATTMDRPEWVTSHPSKGEVYCALTNNKNRGVKPNKGGDWTPVQGPNPREANKYGQIVRWMPEGGDHTADKFTWNLFVLAGNPEVHPNDDRRGSANINAGNMFNSPDGIAFDTNGLLWIQTDGKYSNEGDFAGMGNNQMLIGDTETGEIRRFLVGPKEAEITGITWSADRKTVFVGVQHPGEDGDSHWPDGGSTVPRSSVIAIKRDDGGVIG